MDPKKGEEGVQSYSQILFAVADHASLLASGLHVAKESSDALKSAYHQVSEALSGVGEPILLGTVAAGLLLPGDCSIDVLVHKSGYTLQQHADMVKETKTALSAAGFEHVKTETNFCCQKDGIQVVVRFGDEQRFEPAAFQNAYADDPERDLVLASLLPYRTRFFQSQPPSAKHFLRIVRYWAEVMHAKDWEGHPDSVPSAFLLELLALDAFQSIPGDLNMEERMDAAMNKFLKNTSQLTASTLIFSEMYYRRDSVMQALSLSEVQGCLRPAGFERHPLVLDPASLSVNAAVETKDLSRLVEAAREDLRLLMSMSPASLQEMQKKMEEMQTKVDMVQRVLSTVVSSSFKVSADFEFKALGSKWLEKEPYVLLSCLQVGAVTLNVVTHPTAVVENDYGYYTAEIDVKLVVPKQSDKSAIDLLHMLPPTLKVKMSNLSVTSSFKSAKGNTEQKKAEGKFMDTVLKTSPGSTSAGFGFTAAHIFDAAGYAFSQGGYGSEENLKSLIEESSLVFKGQIVLSA